jgi:hypothetical protein
MEKKDLSEEEIARLQDLFEERFDAFMSKGGRREPKMGLTGAVGAGRAVPGLPKDPGFFGGLKILDKSASAMKKYHGDIGRIGKSLLSMALSSQGKKLQSSLIQAVKARDYKKELFDGLGGYLPQGVPGFPTMVVSNIASAGAVVGGGMTSGFAFPIPYGGRVKFVQGVTGYAGAMFGASDVLFVGFRRKEIAELGADQFYGACIDIDVEGVSVAVEVYLNTDNGFEGFSVGAGIGVGFALAVMRGAELAVDIGETVPAPRVVS